MESLSMQLQPFFQWLLRTTLQASLLICLILIFQTVLRSRLGARWHNCLWLLLFIRLAIPWAPQSRLSIFNLIPRSITQQQTEYARQEIIDDTAVSEPTSPSTTKPKRTLTTTVQQDNPKAITTAAQTHKETKGRSRPVFSRFAEILPLIWLTGALVLGVYVTAGNFRLWRLVTRERPLTDQKILDLLEDCKLQIGIRTILGVVITDKVKSPALFGFVRPRLLLPKGIIETLSREELSYVFLHELAHLKRHDIYIGYLASLLQVLHWFNPLVWLAFYRIRTDRELACDELVLARTQSGESKDYGRTIVSLLERFSRPRQLPAMAGIMETKAQLKRRIRMIARFKQNSYRCSPWAILLIVILACISLPNARRTRASETLSPKPAHQPDFRKIRIPTKPGNGVLSPDGKKLAFVSKHSIWVVPVHGKVSSDIAGEPVRLPGTKGAWRWGMNWSADGKWIAYNNLKNDEICVVPSSGGKVKRISVNKNRGVHLWNYRLSLSPDGKTVAFAAIEKEKIQLFTVNVEGADVNQLTEDGGTQPAFSPDGKKITYVKERPQKRETPESDVWVISASGGTPDQVSDLPGRVIAPIWSPDGKMIAFTRTAEIDESKEICIVQVSEAGNPEASPTQIELPLVTWNFLAGWTPDNKIGVLLTEPVHRAIYTVPASGGNAVQVTPAGWPCHPRWSPDGERIYFRWGGGDLASVPSDGGEISTAPLDADSKIFAALPGAGNAVSPDGKKIVFSGAKMVLRDNKKAYEVNIYTIPIEGGEPNKLTISPGQDRFPCWSPDGKSIAFIRYPEPSKEMSICIVPAEGGKVRQFTSESDKVAWATIAWSPDGKSIAYFSEDKTIRVIPVQGGQPRIVVKVEDVNSHSELAWSPDGSKLAYSAKGSIWAVSLDGGEPEEIKTGLDAKANHLSWSPDGKKIAFSAAHGGDQELWLMEDFLPGTAVAKPEPMTTVRRIGYEWRGPFASLSPDGRYMSDRDWDTGTLVVREMATGKIRTLVGSDSHEAGYPLVSAISPDSKEIAYLWHDLNTKASSLHLVGLDGAGHRVLCKGKWPMPRDWSADGQKILATILENNVAQMVWISASDGSIQHIVDVSLGYLGKVDISSDGRFIAYDHPQAEGALKRDIFVFDLRENRELSVVNHPADDKFLGWTPDGRYMFFASNRTGTWDAWLLPVAGGKPQGFPKLARHGIGNITPIGFTPQGSYYYGHEQTLEDVFVAKLDLETGQFLSEPAPIRQSGATASHDWSPDGRYLAYCERLSDESQAIHIRTLATGRERTLANNLPYIRWLRWSPDMRSFLIDGYKRGGSQGVIFKIDVQTGEQSDIVRSTAEVLIRPEMSPDGKTLFYDRNDDKTKSGRLVARDLESGREKELFRNVPPARLTGRALSPDGQWFVLSIINSATRPAAPVLKILSTAGGEPRDLIQFDKSEELRAVGVTWTPDSQNVLFWKWWYQADKELELWRIPAEGGEPRKLCSRKAIGHIRVHPDGQRVAFYDRSTTRGFWVMENFLPRIVSKAKQSR